MAQADKSGLKSAYDLAMERLGGKEGGLVTLSAAQKQAIAAEGQKTKARVAELEIMYQQRLAQAAAGSDPEKVAKEVARLEEERNAELQKARDAGDRAKAQIRTATP